MASSATNPIADLQRQTDAFGCPKLISLREPQTEAHLDYLDLTGSQAKEPLLPHAVAEFQGRPLLYLLDDLERRLEASSTDQRAQDLGQLLANRSEHAVLGVVRPGELTLYPVNLNRAVLDNTPSVTILHDAPDAPFFFQNLASGSFSLDGQPQAPDYVFDEIHSLLASADQDLAATMRPLDILSVAGRALFFRFLHDRRIVLPRELSEICPPADDLKDVFSDAERAAATSCWLDETFNGDFLPLADGPHATLPTDARRAAYTAFFRQADAITDGKLFLHLEAVMRGWKNVGGSSFQTTIDWDDFNFAHIPVGVLSQIYETFSRRWDDAHADDTSVHYTPKNIARLLVDEALAGLEEPQDAVILDPACGAGVFLVLAFRQLLRLHWKKTGRRPGTDRIHHVLYKQLRGFDVSESALRLAALALYITSIEVNGTTRPPKSLKFPSALKGKVLFNFGFHDEEERHRGFVLGSLAQHVPTSFDGQFDVVIGNPPWTRLRSRRNPNADSNERRRHNALINREFSAITRRALKKRNIEGIDAGAYTNPDNNPDLPFVWRSTEWAKPGGMIAMALPGRIILKQSPAGRLAREALLRGLTITGILNGSDLEKTSVWPNMDLPFLLFFARNTVPSARHQFSFLTPFRENALCRRSEFRLDYRSAQAVSVDSAIAKPWLLKSLGLGSILDVEVIDKIAARALPTVSDIWTNLVAGEGYNISPGMPQTSADHLLDLPDFKAFNRAFDVRVKDLIPWGLKHQRTTAQRPRAAALYYPPLVILPQTPGATREKPKAYLFEDTAVAFSQSFYGYSTAGHENSKGLARLLYLVVHSQLWVHHCLTHSSRIGASYRTILKQDLDDFCFPDPSTLTTDQWHCVQHLTDGLRYGEHRPFGELDEFVSSLYGLSVNDMAVIEDTVRFGSPFRSARLPAEHPPTRSDIEAFCQYLADMIQPFVDDPTGLRVFPVLAEGRTYFSSWRFICMTTGDAPIEISPAFLSGVVREGNRMSSSRIVLVLPQGGLLVGLLNQQRFWSDSRARLCGLHIVRQHLSAFR